MIIIGEHEVDGMVEIRHEGVLIEPAAVLVCLKYETQHGIRFESEPVNKLAVLDAGRQWNRLDQAECAEPNVHDPVLSVKCHNQEPMASGRDCLGAEQDPRCRRVDVKAERLQQQLEQSIQFEAVPAAAFPDDLLEQLGGSQRDRPAKVNVQVLEWHMEHMLPMQFSEEPKVCAGCLRDLKTVQVGGDIDGSIHLRVSINQAESGCQVGMGTPPRAVKRNPVATHLITHAVQAS